MSRSVTPSAPASPSTSDPNKDFIETCVDYIELSVSVGNLEPLARWSWAQMDEGQVREGCATLAESDPAGRVQVVTEARDLNAFFAAIEADTARKRREEAAAKKQEERRLRAFFASVAAAEERAKVDRYLRAVAAATAAQERDAVRQGEALVDAMCGGASGWYRYQLNPVRVWLDRCDYSAPSGWGGGGGGGGGDLDCADYGYEFEIDPSDDPYGLDRDNDGIACEGW